MDADAYIQRLAESNPLREPTLRSVIQALHLPSGGQGLDVGCGIGLQTLLLADAVGPSGQVTGLDLSPEFLLHAEATVHKAGLAERISFRQGDMNVLPFGDHTFDWVWSADCVGYPAGELLPLLREVARVVRPGGSLAILGWSSQQLLPGYPLLEARLNATCSGFAPFVTRQKPEAHFTRALRWFHAAGLEESTARTFAGDVQAPLGRGIPQALTALFEMLWGEQQPEVSPEDWSEYQRLCQPGSPDFVLNLPDYYAFFTYTLFRGKVPNSPYAATGQILL
ncbi:MAG TPA: class I SAM-dependent methyltransferase [Anaerolineae bacterium]|nr:class I SAM-dependent methyltransferase [Anaerolineae bacterium]